MPPAERLEVEREAALKQWRLGVERANYEAQRAERRYRTVDPDNRLVARVRTDEDTIALLRRLVAHYPDGVIAGIGIWSSFHRRPRQQPAPPLGYSLL